MGISLKKGHGFAMQDDSPSGRVAIVNEAFARRFFSNADTLGHRVRLHNPDGQAEPLDIVAVCGNARGGINPNATPPLIFVPFFQEPHRECVVLLRAPSEAWVLAVPAESAIHGIDREQPVDNLQTLAQVRDRALSIPRVLVSLMAGIGFFAFGLAAVGIYGIIACATAQRRFEMGVRLALGATRRDLLRLVMGQGAVPIGAGLILGLGCAAAVAKLMRGVLFGVPAYDAATFGSVTLVIVVVCLAACFVPARRAAGADPVAALRRE
jgi:putative ABC transport system permease protein